MNRVFTKFAQRDSIARALMNDLLLAKEDVEVYRQTMLSLGNQLAACLVAELNKISSENVCVICTVEDADFLARGVIQGLSSASPRYSIAMMCMWNDRIKANGVSVSPVLRAYEEKFDKHNAIYVVVKSIISGACVVKTNITRALSSALPEKVFVLSPVMLSGAEDRLSREFPSEISEKFSFVHFATDDTKNGDEVLPGIGGSVYQLLGLGDGKHKNTYVPKIVKERRRTVRNLVEAQ